MAGRETEMDDIARFESQLEKLRGAVGAIDPRDTEPVVLSKDALQLLNQAVDSEENSLLMQSVQFGRHDAVDFCLRCDGLDINAYNSEIERAADIAWSMRDYVCLLKLLRADSKFPNLFSMEEVDLKLPGSQELKDFTEKRTRLHRLIEEGDLPSIQEETEYEKSHHFFSPDHETAILRAAKNNQFQIYGYLVFIGVKFTPDDRDELGDLNEEIREGLKHSLESYFVQDENSQLIKIMASSKILGKFSDKRRDAINRLFNALNDITYTKVLMKVLEYEDFDVIFDFDSEVLDRACDPYKDETYGLTEPEERRIYIGAKNSDLDPTAFSHVAGTLAHELCHMAMETMFWNEAKPYKAGDKGREKEFLSILKKVKGEVRGRTGVVHELIGTIFEHYPNIDSWITELIVRVPHVLAKCGEAEGEKLLKDSVPELWEFYTNKVFPECEEYIHPENFLRPLCSIESLIHFHRIGKESDRRTSPFKEDMWSFRDYVSKFRKLSIIFASNTELCALHVYHELNPLWGFHEDRKCLLLDLSCFYGWQKQVISAFRCRACSYLVMVSNEENAYLEDLSSSFETVQGKQKEVIIILDEASKDPEECKERKVARYGWSDLSGSKKKDLLSKSVNYQGKELSMRRLVNEESAMNIMNPKALSYLLSNEKIEIGVGMQLKSSGYEQDSYIERKFTRIKVKNISQMGNDEEKCFFVTGIRKSQMTDLGIDESVVQEIGEGEELITGKRILLPKDENLLEKMFNYLKTGRELKKTLWIHKCGEGFYVRDISGVAAIQDNMFLEETTSEKDLLTMARMKNERAILISDDPGTGKTTVISDLINKKMKVKSADVFIARINFNDLLCRGGEDDRSLLCIEEGDGPADIVKYIKKVIGLSNHLELSLFDEYLKTAGRCWIFLDGFDEIAPLYEEKAIRLLSTLIKHTEAQMFVSTRTHHSLALEALLRTASFSLRGFTDDDKSRYVSKMWKRKMVDILEGKSSQHFISHFEDKVKAIRDELVKSGDGSLVESLTKMIAIIEGDGGTSDTKKMNELQNRVKELNFEQFAKKLFTKVSNSTSDQDKRFTNTPLQANMLAIITFENNLKMHDGLNIYKIYSKFVSLKFEIFCVEKVGMQQCNQATENVKKSLMQLFQKAHIKISACVMQPDAFPWRELDLKEMKSWAQDFGLVKRTGKHWEFTHRTYAEFFYCTYIFKHLGTEKMDGRTLETIFRDRKCSASLRFCDAAMEEIDLREKAVNAKLKYWRTTDVLEDALKKATINGDLSGMHFLSCLLEKYSTLEDFVQVMKNYEEWRWYNRDVCKLLTTCMSDDVCHEMFDSEFILTSDFTTSVFELCEFETVRDLLEKLRRGRSSRRHEHGDTGHSPPPQIHSTGSVTQSVEVEGGKEEKGMRFMDLVNEYGRNILFIAARNEDGRVLTELILFFVDIGCKERTKGLLLERNRNNYTSMEYITDYVKINHLNLLKAFESVLDKETIVEMLNERGGYYYPKYIHAFALHLSCDDYDELMCWLIRLCGGEVPKQLKLKLNTTGRSIWHLVAYQNEDFRSVFRNLRKWWRQQYAREEFKNEITRCDIEGATAFHLRAWNIDSYPLRDLKELQSILGRDDFVKLMTKENYRKMNCLHASFNRQSTEIICDNLKFVKEFLKGDPLIEFVMARDGNGDTLLHKLCVNFNGNKKYVLMQVKAIIGESNFQKLLETRNSEGRKVEIVYEGDKYYVKWKI